MSGPGPSSKTGRPSTPGPVDHVSVYADAPNRSVGYVIDALVLTALSFVGAVVISVVWGPAVTIDAGGASQVTVDRGLAVANAILGTVVSLVYFVGSWRVWGASPGQRLLRMHVSGVDGSVPLVRWVIRWAFLGVPIAVVAAVSIAAAGWVVLVTSLLVGLWFVLLVFSIARSATKQGWLDRAARTVVTKSRVRPVEEAEITREESGNRAH